MLFVLLLLLTTQKLDFSASFLNFIFYFYFFIYYFFWVVNKGKKIKLLRKPTFIKLSKRFFCMSQPRKKMFSKKLSNRYLEKL